MNVLQKALNWAKEYEFTAIDIEYATKLAIKMLLDNCKMSYEERLLFMVVYYGISQKNPNPVDPDIFRLLEVARSDDILVPNEAYVSQLKELWNEEKANFVKTSMKAYKALIRENLSHLYDELEELSD